MGEIFRDSDVLGLVKPAIDAHSLGMAAIAGLLVSCGLRCSRADEAASAAAGKPDASGSGAALKAWIAREKISSLGFSYRLDPKEGAALFASLVRTLRRERLLADQGGPIGALYFAGLPEACDLVQAAVPYAGLFRGDESPLECMDILGVPHSRLPASLSREVGYDAARLSFGRDLIEKGDYKRLGPIDRSDYPRYGKRGDRLGDRLASVSSHGAARADAPGAAGDRMPLMRAHVGPFLPDRKAAVDLFLEWTERLAASGLLDILSIGSSQLSQSAFGEDWEGRADGGGVPLATPEEYGRVWAAARPMLVRTYSGTKGIEALARMYEERIDIAWHALSLWWFCELDGRGTNPVRDNLDEHFAAIRFAAASGKPFEPNVPHHFAFRGGDDISYVVSGYLAARAAKAAGIRELVLQVMLNTPKSTWGVQDLAKARVLLTLVRSLEGPLFRVYFQPRGGLACFSRDEERAKAQLAAIAALMDDIEPLDGSSPRIIHVVSYTEGTRLADPEVVDESIRITRHALGEYRRLRRAGEVDDMSRDAETAARTQALLAEARATIAAIEGTIADPYSPAGLYECLASGFLVAPRLDFAREEFAQAARWETSSIEGSVRVVDAGGAPVPTAERLAAAVDAARARGNAARPRGNAAAPKEGRDGRG